MFRNLLKNEKKEFYFIKDGQIDITNTGGFTASSAVGGVALKVKQYEDSIGITTGIWYANWWISNNTIPFSNYSKMCLEFSRTPGDSYGCFAIFKEKTYDAAHVLYELIETTGSVPREVLKYDLPNPIPAGLDKLYCLFTNNQSEVRIYNMWLE